MKVRAIDRNSRGHRTGRRRLATGVLLVAVASLLAACTGAPSTETLPGFPVRGAAAAGGADDLRGVCPQTVSIQTNWWPQPEYAAIYRLLGGDVTVDTDGKSVSAPLTTAAGQDTGVALKIVAGGPARSYTPAARLLYLDDSLMIGGVDLDQSITLSGQQPVRTIFAPMRRSPVTIMWDPASQPGVRTINDLGRKGTPVITFPESAYVDYLTGSGILQKGQVDPSYDGTPARFVAERGKIAQQAFVTSEVYQFERELPQWNKPVAFQLVDDLGYPNYPETLGVRADREAQYAPCLRKLVPIMQRAAVDYLATPLPTNELLSTLVDRLGGYPFSVPRAEFATSEMKRLQIMGAPGEPIGGIDPAKAQRLLTQNVRIAADRGTPTPPGLRADSLYTNAYLDSSITPR